MATAIEELYDENISQMTEADYAEHPNAWLRYCYDNGPMYVLNVNRNGIVRLEQWADQDDETELTPESSKSDVAREDALRLWMWLLQSDIDKIASSGLASE